MEVLVQKIPSDVTENRLRLYFGNPKRGGPVEVRDFNSDKMEAVLFFKDDEVAEKVLDTKEFEFKKDKIMTVSHATSKSETEESDTFVDWDDTDDPSIVLMQGLPSRSSEDDVYRILEELTEITPDYVTAIKVHQNKRSALVKLKDTDDAKCVLELGSEENDGYTITFMSPASQIDTTEEPVPKRSASPTECTDTKENNNNRESEVSRHKREDSSPESFHSDHQELPHHSRPAKQANKIKEKVIQPREEQTKQPKAAPRSKPSKGSSTSSMEDNTVSPTSKASVSWAASVTEVSEKRKSFESTESSADQRPVVRPKPRKSVPSRYTSEDNSEKENEEKEKSKPVLRQKGKLEIPVGLVGQDIVSKLGQKRVSKKVSVDDDEEEEADEKEKTPPPEMGRMASAYLPTNVIHQLKGKLQSRQRGCEKDYSLDSDEEVSQEMDTD